MAFPDGAHGTFQKTEIQATGCLQGVMLLIGSAHICRQSLLLTTPSTFWEGPPPPSLFHFLISFSHANGESDANNVLAHANFTTFAPDLRLELN